MQTVSLVMKYYCWVQRLNCNQNNDMNLVFFSKELQRMRSTFSYIGGSKGKHYASTVQLEEPTNSFYEDYVKSAVNNFYNGCMTLISPSLRSCVWRDDAGCF